MTRGVYTENLASFVLAVVAEVLARLCFEVPTTPPQALFTPISLLHAATVYFLLTFSTQPSSGKRRCCRMEWKR